MHEQLRAKYPTGNRVKGVEEKGLTLILATS